MARCGFCNRSIISWSGHRERCVEWVKAGKPEAVLVEDVWQEKVRPVSGPAVVKRVTAPSQPETAVAPTLRKRGRPVHAPCACGKPHYAHGLCKTCYMRDYMRQQRARRALGIV